MHIPDGYIGAGPCAAAGVVAAGGVGVALRRAGQELDERHVPLTGLVAAFVFAAQLVNVPVASGTSGHVLGAGLATVLVGPWAASVCLTVVVGVQALLFADGGLSALGLNVLNMALVAVFGAWAVFRVLRWVLPDRRGGVAVVSGVAAGASVVLAAGAFGVEYAFGGQGAAPATTVMATMLGVHVPIGIVDGVVTSLVVRAVLASRPDLVWGARGAAGGRRPVRVPAPPVPA